LFWYVVSIGMISVPESKGVERAAAGAELPEKHRTNAAAARAAAGAAVSLRASR
jgi:hypothetical protein